MVSRPLMLGLASAAAGFVLGAALGVASGSMPAFLSMFALITLVGSLAGAVAVGRHVQETPDGYVGLGDTFFAMGTLIVLVEAVGFFLTGHLLAAVLGAAAVGLTLWALRQERQVSLAVSAVMGVLALSWAMTVSEAIILGTAPALLWAFGAAALGASIATGESIEEPVSA